MSTITHASTPTAASNVAPTRILAIARCIALAAVFLPLFMIGYQKFTQHEVEGLIPLIGGTPWLAWMYSVLGTAGASYFLGVVELSTAFLFLASIWSPRAGILAGALGTLTFTTTVSIMLAVPIWEPASGGFPFLNSTGGFLIKDVGLLAISLYVLGTSLQQLSDSNR